MSDTPLQDKERHISSSNQASQGMLSPDQVLDKLTNLLGASNVQADPEKNEHYRMGWRLP